MLCVQNTLATKANDKLKAIDATALALAIEGKPAKTHS